MAPRWLAALTRKADIPNSSASNFAHPYLFLNSPRHSNDETERRFLCTSHDNVACRPLRLAYGGLHPPFTIYLRNPYATALLVNASKSTYAMLGPFEENGNLDWRVEYPTNLWLQAAIVDGMGLETTMPPLWVKDGTSGVISGVCW